MKKVYKYFFVIILLICAGLLFPFAKAECRGDRTIDSLERILKNAPPKKQGTICLNLARAYSTFDHNKTVEYFNLSIDHYLKLNQNVSAVIAYINFGSYCMRTGEYNAAMIEIQRGIDLAKKIGNKVYLVYGYAILSAIYRRTGRYEEALNAVSTVYKDYNFEKVSADIALMKKEKRNPTQEEAALYNIIALLYNNFGLIYQEIQMEKEAIQMYHCSEFISGSIKSYEMQYNAYYNLITLFNETGQLDSIDYYLMRFNKIFKDVDVDSKVNDMKRLKASVLFQTKRYKEALDIYTGISASGDLFFSEAFDDMMKTAQCCAELYLWSRLKKTLDKVEPLLSKVAVIDRIPYYKCKIEYYKACGMLEEAIYYADTLQQISDEVLQTGNNTTLVSQIANIQFQDKVNRNKFLKRQNELLDIQLANKKKLRVYAIILSVILLLVILWFVRNSRINKRIAKNYRERNDALKELNNELDISNATKDKFCSIIAHDLKNPIGNFNDAIRILNEHFDEMTDEEVDEYVNMLQESGNISYQLLNDLLDWSKAQRNEITVSIREIRPFEFINQVIAVHTVAAKNKDIELVNSVNPSLLVLGDSYMLRTIVRNLVSNSIKFTGKGGRVEIGSQPGEKGQVIIYVKDNGVGMSEEQMTKIFRIDSNVSTPGTAGEKGTGLGLVLCKEFANKNGGDLTVSSKPGEGSRFNIILRASKNFSITS